MTESQFKYFAFISYNSKDTEWGKRVQRKLEHYRMPSTLCSKQGWKREPIKPVFFAPTDIQPGGLSEELQERLRASRNLVVICSPNSAQSEWVGKEIDYFHQLGRTKQIHFFIVDGTPHSGNPDTECFNPIVESLGLPEILGANIHEKIYRLPWLNKERAYVQLVSKLLGVEFDTIWQRHKRQLIQKVIAWTIGIAAVLSALIGVWLTNQPIDVEVCLKETSVHNQNLPAMSNAIVTMKLDNEVKTDTVRSMDTHVFFANIPHRFLNRQVEMTISCSDYLDVDTMLLLTQKVEIGIQRNPIIYGNVHFRLWDSNQERFVTEVRVKIAGHEVVSDDNGCVNILIPLEEQKVKYHIQADLELEIDTIFMPCVEETIIVVNN